MKIESLYMPHSLRDSLADHDMSLDDPFQVFEYRKFDCEIKHEKTGEVLFEAKDFEVPADWSDNACQVFISKYARQAGVPEVTVSARDCKYLIFSRSVADETFDTGPERSVTQVVRRVVGFWTYHGIQDGYFDDYESAYSFYYDMVYMIMNQMASPNSPQWFNSGIHWAYGIKGEPQGNVYVEDSLVSEGLINSSKSISETRDALKSCVVGSVNGYAKSQVHACFILDLQDSLLGENGISSWIERETRIFRGGSGSGVNISKLRGAGEKISHGGHSSGSMSFVRSADRNAGAIKSGGTTRRAAKMLVMDIDHPDIEEFIESKVKAEQLVAAMVTGSEAIKKSYSAINIPDDESHQGVPQSVFKQNIDIHNNKLESFKPLDLSFGFNDLPYEVVPYQNANNSVRATDEFMGAIGDEAIGRQRDWDLVRRTDGRVHKTVGVNDLWDKICEAAWLCADPGVQFDTTINDWNVTPLDGGINASNPCSEHMRLDSSACNLASLRLTKFYDPNTDEFDIKRYSHAVRLWMFALDISNSASHLPDEDIAIGVYLYRDVGLGFADLGSLLMSMGLEYGGDKSLAVAGAITALHQGVCHIASSEMARDILPYPRFQANKDHHLRCVREHIRLLNLADHLADHLTDGFSRNIPIPWIEDDDWSQQEDFKTALSCVWGDALEGGLRNGYRNAEMSVIAPCGTIGIVMDCDTTGVEPMFGLVVHKTLAGGGEMVIRPQECVENALYKILGGDIDAPMKELVESQSLVHWIYDERHGSEIRNVFLTAAPDPVDGKSISGESHVNIMAVVQSFISGAISKTVNLPNDASVEDISDIYRMSWNKGVKAISVYRDGSKFSQPLMVRQVESAAREISSAVSEKVEEAGGCKVERRKLGSIRKPGIDIAVQIAGGTLYVKTTRYDNGDCGEIWATYTGSQGCMTPMLSCICRSVNILLQYSHGLDNAPQEVLKTLMKDSFEPKGFVFGHPNIKSCTSVTNLLARIILFHEYDDHSVIQIPVAASQSEHDEKVLEAVAEDAGGDFQLVGEECPQCGSSSEYVVTGTSCKKCLNCGYSGGCG